MIDPLGVELSRASNSHNLTKDYIRGSHYCSCTLTKPVHSLARPTKDVSTCHLKMRGRAGGSLSLLPGYGFGSRPGRTRRDAGKATDASLGACFALVASSTESTTPASALDDPRLVLAFKQQALDQEPYEGKLLALDHIQD